YHARRRLRRAPVRGLDALVPPVLHDAREGLLAEGARDPAGGPGRARAEHHEPPEPRARGEALRLPARARVPRGALSLLRDAPRAREEDRPDAVRESAAVGAHR